MMILVYLKRILTNISGTSIVIAATWFGAAAFVMASHLWWGLAMAALPVFLLALAGAGPLAKRNRRVLAAVAAGALVLTALGGGLTAARQAAQPLPISARSATAQANAHSNEAATAASAEAATTASTEAVHATPARPVESAGFVASRQGEVYHLPDCASAKRIKPENLAAYATLGEAEAAGLRPCKRCKPNESAGGSTTPNDTKTTGGSP